MPFTTLISVPELAPQLGNADWALVDCRFSLADSEQGRRAYLAGHIPGAVYAHLDTDLASTPVPGQTGRHPLPDIAAFAQQLGQWGIDERVQVVAYDDWGGGMAARLWWMLRWLGHEAVAVLDGGIPAWERAGLPLHAGPETRAPRTFTARPQEAYQVTAADVLARHTDPTTRLIDARTADRYRGEVEPIDPVGGHIPGAKLACFLDNLDEQGHVRAPAELRARYEQVLGDVPAEQAIVYCGSGVTAAHNVLAMLHAGLGQPQLYVGSWSEWSSDPQRPMARGDD